MPARMSPRPMTDLVAPTVVGWGALAAALGLGGADAWHYAVMVCGLIAACGAAVLAWRRGLRRLAMAFVIGPPLVAAGLIVLFMIRMIFGFFG